MSDRSELRENDQGPSQLILNLDMKSQNPVSTQMAVQQCGMSSTPEELIRRGRYFAKVISQAAPDGGSSPSPTAPSPQPPQQSVEFLRWQTPYSRLLERRFKAVRRTRLGLFVFGEVPELTWPQTCAFLRHQVG